MDATGPGDDIGTSFSVSFPLALRILCLTTLGVAGWATNLHVLCLLGIDTGSLLDVRVSETNAAPASSTSSPPSLPHLVHIHPSRLYPPIYAAAGSLVLWTALGVGVYSAFGRDVDSWNHRFIPIIFLLSALLALIAPWDRLKKRERYMFLRCVRAPRGMPLRVPPIKY